MRAKAHHADCSERGPAPARQVSAVRRSGYARLIAAVALVAGHAGGAAAPAQSEVPSAPVSGIVAPYRWWPQSHLFYAGPCTAYGFCGPNGWWLDRPPPRRPAAPEPPRPADPDIWSTSGSPWGYVRRLPPPTPADQIQPRYRDASTIRPEFAERAATAP
jgi:hypothetical protein